MTGCQTHGCRYCANQKQITDETPHYIPKQRRYVTDPECHQQNTNTLPWVPGQGLQACPLGTKLDQQGVEWGWDRWVVGPSCQQSTLLSDCHRSLKKNGTCKNFKLVQILYLIVFKCSKAVPHMITSYCIMRGQGWSARKIYMYKKA